MVTSASVQGFASRILWVIFALCCVTPTIQAADRDLTVFGGIQRAGKLTFQSAPGTTSNLIQNFDPKTFGVFGARFSHGKVFGGEHTLAYAPNFLDSRSSAVIYHSNLRIQAPLPVLRPYGTVGIGLIHSGGTALSSFGSKFAFNYGGGVNLTAGPVGLNLDLRGYAVPKVSITGFGGQERMDFLQATAGIVFRF